MKIVRRILSVVAVMALAALAFSVSGCSSSSPCTSTGQIDLATWAARLETPEHARKVSVERPYCFRDSNDVAFDTMNLHFRTHPHARAAVFKNFMRQLAHQRWHRANSNGSTFRRRDGDVTLWVSLSRGNHGVDIDLADGGY